MTDDTERNTVAKAFADSDETPRGENSTPHARQRLIPGIRFVLRSTLLLQGHKNQGEGQEPPLEPIWTAASVQPLMTGDPRRDSEMPEEFRRMAARRKAILVAWGEPLVSWRKQIKFQK